MPHSLPWDMPGRLVVRPWPDPVVDQLGFDPAGPLTDRFWLPVLGPTATCLLRRFAARLEAEPEGFEWPMAELSRSLGLGAPRGRESRLGRTLGRVIDFGLARAQGPRELGVRRRLPPLSLREVGHLPPALRVEYRQWQEEQRRPEAALRRMTPATR